MTPEQLREFENLKRKVVELSEWKFKKEQQQILLPLDLPSQKVVRQDIPVFISQTTNTPTATGFVTFTINGQTFTLLKGA